MASAFLLSAAADDPRRDPKALLDLEQMRESAAVDGFGVHQLAGSPADADLVLFVETSAGGGPYFERVRRHPVFRAHRDRSYVFCSTDSVVALLPGIYASVEQRWYRDAWTRTSGYLGVKERPPLAFADGDPPSALFSFAGSGQAHPVRRRILDLPSTGATLVDSDRSPLGREGYADAIRDADFILCPRGGGTATFRLFEAMMLGRAPVIISDQWVPPAGPDWDRFSVRVAEREVELIPRLLAARRPEAAAMGVAARSAWLDWFSPEASFHRIVDWCLELAERSAGRSGWRRWSPYPQLLRPRHALRYAAKRAGSLR